MICGDLMVMLVDTGDLVRKLRDTKGTCAYRQPEAVDSQDEPWLALEEEWLALPATKGPYPTATLVEELELFMYV